ncbi:Ger(x)C family spore germination protein [Paenibacillus sp. PL2-23]|uniref:Ger(x)C family spore germination protein n=1 Tax=Paenibacillus sp. PL2-23 TaxID=2100729 RepID=UPI0030FCA18E
MNSKRVAMRLLRCALMALLLLPLAGCWSRVEVNDRAFVMSMYIDAAPNNKVELTVNFPLPNHLTTQTNAGASADSPPFASVSAKGMTLAEAYRELNSDLSREIYWGQTKTIVVGKAFAERGIAPLLEFISRNPQFPIKTFVMVAPGKAKEISTIKPRLETQPSDVFREYANRRVLLDTSIRDCMMAEEYGSNFIIGMLDIRRIKEFDKTEPRVITDGGAYFKGGKLAAIIDERGMRGAMWLMNRMEDAVITVPSPSDGKPVSIIIYRTHTSIKPRMEGDRPVFHAVMKPIAQIMSIDSEVDYGSPERVEEIEQAFNEDIKKRVMTAFQLSKSLGSDVFQLGAYLNWHMPRQWKLLEPSWEELYREEAVLEVEVQTRLELPGMQARKSSHRQ